MDYKRIKPEDNHHENSKWNILLVEDNDSNQMAGSLFLEDMGYNFDVAENGKQALKMYKSKTHYHMILLDIGLPDINGIEVCKRIRKQELKNRTHIPIIALTAFGEFVEDECWDAGVDEFTIKPIMFGEMNQTMQHWLPKSP